MARGRAELPPSKPPPPLERMQAWLRSEFLDEQKRAANMVRTAVLCYYMAEWCESVIPVLQCFCLWCKRDVCVMKLL